MTNKKVILFFSIIYIEIICLTVININSQVDFNINPNAIPTLPTQTETVETYVGKDNDNGDDSATKNNVNLNKVYYQQRLSLVKKQTTQNPTTQVSQQSPTQQPQTQQPQVQQPQVQQPTQPKKRIIDTKQYQDLIASAETWLNVPYVWGGESRSGVDCSGFVQQLYKSFGVNLPRTSREQSKVGLLVERNELLPGDLLFFDTNTSDPSNPTTVSHVGMYVGSGKMIHAGSGNGVVEYTNLETNYYTSRFMNARRILVPKIKEE